MDNHDRKRRDQVARMLADGAVIILLMLRTLDDIRLYPHTEAGARERVAEDLMMVRRSILPTVEAEPEALALVASILLDWVTLNDLVSLGKETGYTPRLFDTMDDLASRLAMGLVAARELGLVEGE